MSPNRPSASSPSRRLLSLRRPLARARLSRRPPASRNSALPTGEGEVETVQPFDTLDINVLQLEPLNRTVEVNSVGMISLPLAGDFHVVGKTTKQIAADIAARSGSTICRTPRSPSRSRTPRNRASLRDTARRGFTVEGSVTQPGVYSIYGPTTLLQGLAMAKGVDQYANEKHVTVFREVNGQNQVNLYNLARYPQRQDRGPADLPARHDRGRRIEDQAIRPRFRAVRALGVSRAAPLTRARGRLFSPSEGELTWIR